MRSPGEEEAETSTLLLLTSREKLHFETAAEETDALLELAKDEGTFVPSLGYLELGNVLLEILQKTETGASQDKV